jgi:hypothetical protein
MKRHLKGKFSLWLLIGVFQGLANGQAVTTENFTLQRARDFTFAGGNVDCPNCKDMFCARLQPGTAGATVVSIKTIAQRPARNNHWYRCEEAAKCGRPEFSNPTDPRESCVGKTACLVCRATDDGVPNYEDDIRMTSR